MYKIHNIKAREILDSRGNPTVEVDILINEVYLGRAAVPSGASVGKFEALELRDKDAARYMGKGVLKAVANVNQVIATRIIGKQFPHQFELDLMLNELDGTPNKANLGANAILGVSMAFMRAVAACEDAPLYKLLGNEVNMPRPMMNVINGGVHADNPLNIQEFMIIPHAFNSFSEKLQAGTEVFHHLKKILKSKSFSISIGDEGGFAPYISSTMEALDYISEAVTHAGYKVGEQISFALDCAASEFCANGEYQIENETLGSEELVDFYARLVDQYPIISIEDPMSEDDKNGWKLMTEALGERIQVVGDDLFVTNPNILQEGIDNGLANAVLIKLNQIGTVTETLETIKLAHDNSYNTIISHRSGETEDTFISHLAVGSGSWQIKTGSLCRTDRTCKYNELLRIEEEL